MPEKKYPKYENLFVIENPEQSTIAKAIRTTPFYPAGRAWIIFCAGGVPCPEITTEYAPYLETCRKNNIIPMKLSFKYDSRWDSFCTLDEGLNAEALSGDGTIANNDEVFRANFLEQIARGGRIHELSFSVERENIEMGLNNLRLRVMESLMPQGYHIYQAELDFAGTSDRMADRLTLNRRERGLHLELSKGKHLSASKGEILKSWFENL